MTRPRTDVAETVLDLCQSRPPTLGGGRLVCIDGPAGSGKTTLAARLAELAPHATVVHMDDLYEGWDGLPTVDAQLEPFLRTLINSRPGSYRRWDWLADAWAEEVTVDPVDLLIVEGVGSGSATVAELITILVWVDAPHDLRMRRGIERDGEAFAPYWQSWAEAEAEHFARHRTRERAHVLVDGAGRWSESSAEPGEQQA